MAAVKENKQQTATKINAQQYLNSRQIHMAFAGTDISFLRERAIQFIIFFLRVQTHIDICM